MIRGHDAAGIAAIVVFGIYLAGIPVSIGVGIAMGLGPLAVFMSPFWPVTTLMWAGYLAAS